MSATSEILDAGPIGPVEAGMAAARRDRLIGLALMCGAVICFAGLDTTAKWLSHETHPLLGVWARYVSSVLLVSLAVNPWSVPGLARTRRPWLQAGRSVLLLASTVCSFFALQYLQVAQTTSIMFAAPLLVALAAGPILGEWIGPRRLAAVAVGFVGVLIITRPGAGMHPAALLSVLGTICYALYAITTRVLAASDSSSTTLFYSGLAGVLLLTPFVPFVWLTPSPFVGLMMLATGVFGGVGHWLLILAHARAPAPVLAPFLYSQLIWASILGYMAFGDLPDGWTLVGATVVIGSGLYLLARERARAAPAHSV
jgi:drug/metabolite transporter (DMT)-like permease